VASLLLIAFFVCFNFHRFDFKGHALEDGERGLSIYRVSLAVAGTAVTVVRQAYRTSITLLAIKRVAIVAFPASITSAVSDELK
jgi:hypothetical protein